MKSWEFLIQKEGDRQWVAIENPTLELETGKYRLLANSNRLSSNIEVRLTHQPPEAENPPSESQKYSRQSNGQGLVMILPYTDFSEGIWHIRCSSDIMSELLGESWRESLEIHVSPAKVPVNSPELSDHRVEETSQTEEKVKENSTIIANNMTPSTNSKAQYYLEQLEDLLNQKIEPLSNNSGLNLGENSPNSFLSLSSSETVTAPTLQLILDQAILEGKPGESVVISGTIEVQEADEDLALTAKLRYQIKHPHTHEILLNLEEPILDELLPYTFSKTLAIPTELGDILFISGEVLLETLNGVSITQYPFKIYTSEHHPVSYSIELFSTEDESSYTFDFEVTEKVGSASANLELPTTPKYRYPLIPALSSSGQVLPPKLTRESVPLKSDKKSLNLPQISQ
ncbi:hypothetical protein PCC8801_1183 [Rippkaea orientalis PCC 8801]|uniref:Uncharacterized protein n=1 Tax=Rippkaea orientalis (strain PCC 8801 / RF-1) TaxID=41431 RepID=B7K2B5_RIPO1|nr:hypothetical protein [Rippkaea orientalis]ACK65251.1 hypothetical protein PCC8801_1183 [Rippkaea orientalis PCC 8801]